MKENGLHLANIEEEEEFVDAWLEWVKDKIIHKRRKRTVTIVDKKIAELKARRPELAPILEEIQG